MNARTGTGARHDNVANAPLPRKSRALAQAQRLGHIDLHVVDEVAIPDRLEQSIGEPKARMFWAGSLPRK